MMPRPFFVALAIALTAVSGLRCAAAQEQPSRGNTEDTEQERRPLLTLEPAAGSPGATVAAKGSGFRGDCGVRLYFDTESGTPLGSAGVDRSGSFTAQVVIPEQATGEQHAVLARGLRPGTTGATAANDCVEPSGNRAEAAFAVRPRDATPPVLVIATREARPGSTVQVAGRGFCGEPGCSTVTVLIDGQVAAGDVQVSPGGTFSAEARVPAINTAGRLAVVAVQTLADQTEIRAFGELETTPRPDVRRRPVR
jgi:hypothetical protein